MMKRIVTTVALAGFVFAGAGIANARPVDNFNAGNANTSNCRVVQSIDRGYIYTIKQVRPGGEVVIREVRKLPYGDNYTIISKVDRGIRQTSVCDYPKK